MSRMHQPKELLLPLGSIRFKRTCYTSKKTGKSVYLLDEVIGRDIKESLMGSGGHHTGRNIGVPNGGKGGEHASLMDSVSKQTVVKTWCMIQ